MSAHLLYKINGVVDKLLIFFIFKRKLPLTTAGP